MTDVVTGEAVVLDLPVANFPSRMAALFIDLLVQLVLYIALVVAMVLLLGSANADYQAAAGLALYVAVFVGYPTVFETLSRGRTLGKMALGLRVVGDDGSPVRFRQALVRALAGLFEIWTYALAPVALITSIVSAKGKRVGDMFAGTYVLQERMPARAPLPPAFAAVPPPLAWWAQALEVSRLSGQTADAAGSYLRRYTELSPAARQALGVQLANAIAAQVSPPPPPGTPPEAYLAAVLAVRRQRDQARFAAGSPVPPPAALAPAAAAAPLPEAPPPEAAVRPSQAPPGPAPQGFAPPA